MDFSVQLVGIEFAQLLDMAQKVEGLGFRTMYFPDHLVLQGPERQAMGVPAFDPMLQAAIVADATKEVRLADVVNIVGGIGRAGYIALAKASKLSSDTFRDKVRSLRAEAARAGRDGTRSGSGRSSSRCTSPSRLPRVRPWSRASPACSACLRRRFRRRRSSWSARPRTASRSCAAVSASGRSPSSWSPG